jgi:hypothetical protein
MQVIEKYGAPGETRTPDLLVRSQTLYPAELRARNAKILPQFISCTERHPVRCHRYLWSPTRKAIRAYSEALSRSVGALVDPRSSGTATPASPEREPKGCALPGTATNAEDKTPDEAKTKEDAETRQDAEPTRK